MTWNDVLDSDRNRIGWWVYLIALGVGVVYVGYSFVGTLVFGLFLYYAARPIDDRVSEYVDDDAWSAGITLAGFVTPILLVVAYVVVAGLQAAASFSGTSRIAELVQPLLNRGGLTESEQQFVNTLLNRPLQVGSLQSGQLQTVLNTILGVLGTIVTVLVLLSLAFALAFFLLRDDEHIAAWFREEIAERGTAGHAYVHAVDDELETVFFGNVLFVFTMAIIAAVVYYGFNLLAPAALTIPVAILLALLTGVASLIPILVGKVVYVPVVAYLGWQATQTPGVSLLYPIGLLVVSFLVLDILPQTFLQPYISGQEIHVGLMMFAYLLGPMLFGWYGFFLLPLFLVLVVEAVRILVTELLHGDRLTPTVDAAPSLGPRPEGTMDDEEDDESATPSS